MVLQGDCARDSVIANNYGPPYGSAEEDFGTILRKDFRGLRNELIILTKAGWDMWPGPNCIGGSRKYLLASLDSSLKRTGLEYVDIFTQLIQFGRPAANGFHFPRPVG